VAEGDGLGDVSGVACIDSERFSLSLSGASSDAASLPLD
jgi:hypothetical protein